MLMEEVISRTVDFGNNVNDSPLVVLNSPLPSRTCCEDFLIVSSEGRGVVRVLIDVLAMSSEKRDV